MPVGGWPTFRIDGILNDDPRGTAAFLSAVTNRNAVPSPVSIDVFAQTAGDIISVTVTINSGDDAVAGNHKLRCAMNSKEYTWAGGSNGQTSFHDDMVIMAPNAAGTDFSIEANSTSTVELSFDWPQSLGGVPLEADNIDILVWIQNDTGKEVLNSAVSSVAQPYGLTLNTSALPSMVDAGSTTNYTLSVINAGLTDDTYDVTIDGEIAEGWIVTYTTPDGTVHDGASTVALTSQENYTSDIVITAPPVSVGDLCAPRITFTSQGFPELTRTANFDAVTAGKIFVINGADDGNLDDYYKSALDYVVETSSNDLSYVYWAYDRALLNMNSIGNIEIIETIIYLTGGEATGQTSDLTAMNLFALAGGNLLVTGANSTLIVNSHALHLTMGLDGINGFAFGQDQVTGVVDDPIGDGLSFLIVGGDGAGNAGIPRKITPSEEAVVCFEFGADSYAGIHKTTDTYKTVLYAFPIESISDADSRNAVMLSTMDFFAGSASTPEAGTNEIPSEFVLNQNYPNPFNPSTEISFGLPERSHVTVTIVNMMGQEVARLANGQMDAGMHSVVWSATDMSSGVYFYRVIANGNGQNFSQTRKMLLLK
jgi:Secretion system C-terminal sorting domain